MEEIEFLEKNKGKWFDARTIAKKLNKNKGTVTSKMRKITKNLIMCRFYDVKERIVSIGRGGPKFEWSINGK